MLNSFKTIAALLSVNVDNPATKTPFSPVLDFIP
jgi:hypothetical protein